MIVNFAKGGNVFGCVCLSVCVHNYSKTIEQIVLKGFAWIEPNQRKKYLNFGKDLDYSRDTKIWHFMR